MNIRNNKGITLMTEVIAVLLLVIIISIISYSAKSSLQIRNLNNMYADIISIQDKVSTYYLKYGSVPIGEEVSENIIEQISDEINPNDSGYYYKVNMSELQNITLNNRQTDDEYYFINSQTLTVYYSKGVKVDNLNSNDDEDSKRISKTYHTLPSNYDGISNLNIKKYQQ